jgi:hypothetical protein
MYLRYGSSVLLMLNLFRIVAFQSFLSFPRSRESRKVQELDASLRWHDNGKSVIFTLILCS